MRNPGTPRTTTLLAIAALALVPAGARAQSAGTTGASVLELPAGSRAVGLAGAFTAVAGDIDAIFYNPSGLAGLSSGAGLSYESYVADVTLGSAAAAFGIGRVVLGAGISYLDAGDVRVLEPDPAYGGQRGRETGATVSAGETALKVSAATALGDGRLRVGISAGYVSSDLAGTTHSAPMADVGLQFRASSLLTVGVAGRNLGGKLSGPGDAALPREIRLGGQLRVPPIESVGVNLTGDYVLRPESGDGAFAGAVEAGLLPTPEGISAMGRLGYSAAAGSDGLGGRIFIGAGLGLGAFSVDYAYQSLDFFGAVHRFGIRWTRP